MIPRTEIRNFFKTKLEGISTANGYNLNIKKVFTKEVAWQDMPKSQFPFICCITGGEDLEWDATFGYKCRLQMIIRGYIREERDNYDPNEELDKLIQDMRKALRPVEVQFQKFDIIKSVTFDSLITDEGKTSPFAFAELRLTLLYFDKDIDYLT